MQAKYKPVSMLQHNLPLRPTALIRTVSRYGGPTCLSGFHWYNFPSWQSYLGLSQETDVWLLSDQGTNGGWKCLQSEMTCTGGLSPCVWQCVGSINIFQGSLDGGSFFFFPFYTQRWQEVKQLKMYFFVNWDFSSKRTSSGDVCLFWAVRAAAVQEEARANVIKSNNVHVLRSHWR